MWFIDLGYSGPAYTWTNKRFSSVPTYERLDRCLGNAEWCMAFPTTTIYHLPMLYSDHAPILAVLNSQRVRTNKPFRFENWWLMEQEYHEVARQSWLRSSARTFAQKTGYLAADLRTWRRKKPRNNDLLSQIEAQLLAQQNIHPSQQNQSLQKQLTEKHQSLLAKEETYHIQRAKKKWAVMGDRNTSFFYQAIVKRNRKNRITHLINPDGSYSTTPDQLSDTLVHYFTTIFTSQNPNHLPTDNNATHYENHVPAHRVHYHLVTPMSHVPTTSTAVTHSTSPTTTQDCSQAPNASYPSTHDSNHLQNAIHSYQDTVQENEDLLHSELYR